MAVAEGLGISPTVVLYMKKKLSRADFERLVSTLDGQVADLVRKDSKFKALGLNPDDYVDNPEAVVDVLVAHPALMQRPVIVRGNRAIVGRPRERVGDFMAG